MYADIFFHVCRRFPIGIIVRHYWLYPKTANLKPSIYVRPIGGGGVCVCVCVWWGGGGGGVT